MTVTSARASITTTAQSATTTVIIRPMRRILLDVVRWCQGYGGACGDRPQPFVIMWRAERATLGDSGMRTHWAVIAALLCVASGCSRSVPRDPELATTASIKDLMDAMVDPSAEYLFDNIVEIV